MPHGPLSRYRRMVDEGRLRPDPAQRAAIEKLQLLSVRLERGDLGGRRGLLGMFRFGASGETEAHGKGLYFFGGVGRGKSMLMDLFFDAVKVSRKRRVHFHSFMQEVHAEINAARARGEQDPIKPAVENLVGDLSLLCFDEMQVTDIADAMILGRFFEGVFARDIAIVVTSNRHPTDLYKDGLNRDLFTPFIEMICDALDVHQLDGPTDYRLARLRWRDVYHTPLGAEATAAMDAAWEDVTDGRPDAPLSLEVQGRQVVLPRFLNGAGRASFLHLCGQPLGPADYLAVAAAVRTLFIDDIPILSRSNYDQARRFVTLIDALYEGRIALFCSAAAVPGALYPSGEGAFEFERTASRLIEMRSADWMRS